MTAGKQAALSCLECGQAIPDGRRWLCSPRCAAVMTLVRYGRKHMAGEDPDEVGLDDARLRRYAAEATIVGRFPTQSVMEKVRVRDRHSCQYVGCDARGADEVDYKASDPDLQRRPQARDLRTLCSVHHRSESLERFVGAPGRIAHSAPATWARIEAAEPLVLRDNHRLWTDPALGLLRAWPLASAETRGDLDRCMEAWREALSQDHGAPGGESDPTALLDAALDHLGLPQRRQERLVRAIQAQVLALVVDEAASERIRKILANPPK